MKINIYLNILPILCVIFDLPLSTEAQHKLKIITGLTDIGNGVGAPNVAVSLYKQVGDDNYTKINTVNSDEGGTVVGLAESRYPLREGIYKLKYNVSSYFESQNRESLYPHIEVSINVSDVNDTYLIIILFDSYGFTTYRGSLSKKLNATTKH